MGLLALYVFLSGFCMVVGGVLARFLRFKRVSYERKLIRSMMAMGGGILVASVSFVLVPAGIKELPILAFSLVFLAGVLTFRFLNQTLSRSGSSFVQVFAMLMDFIPESMALGASYLHDPKMALLLAVFIGLQNIPEGFNAYHELRRKHFSRLMIFGLLWACSILGLIPAFIGHFFLRNSIDFIAMIMIFSSGGILYLVFHDIAPDSRLKNSSSPSIFATLGFLIGMIGHASIG